MTRTFPRIGGIDFRTSPALGWINAVYLECPPVHPGKYNLLVTRKGGVASALPVLPEVVRAYRAYLDTYDLKGYDLAALPMLLPVRLGKKADSVQPTSRSYIWRIVKDVMQAAADLAMEAGDEIA